MLNCFWPVSYINKKLVQILLGSHLIIQWSLMLSHFLKCKTDFLSKSVYFDNNVSILRLSDNDNIVLNDF